MSMPSRLSHPLLLLVCLIGIAGELGSAVPLQAPRTVKNRRDLSDLKNWTDTEVHLVRPGNRPGETRVTTVSARTVYYSSDAVGVGLTVVSDPRTRNAYVVHAGQSFYIAATSEMWSCLMSTSLAIRGSIVKMTRNSADEAELVARLSAKVSDSQLLDWSRNPPRVDLSQGVPNPFWTARGGLDSQGAPPNILAIDLSGGTLRLDVTGGGGRYSGMFVLDFNKRRLLKTMIDGEEVFVAK